MDAADKCIGLDLDPENKSLRRWRIVVVKAYADFQEKIVGLGHASFASLAISLDDLSEGSKFPNLLLPGEREPYGI